VFYSQQFPFQATKGDSASTPKTTQNVCLHDIMEQTFARK